LYNQAISVVAVIYAVLVYIATFFSWISYGTPFPDNPVGWLIFITGIIIAPIVYKKYNNKVEEEESILRIAKLTEMNNVTKKIPDFDYTQKYSSFDENTQFLIDEKKKKIVILHHQQSPKVYEYRDILKSEVIQDGVSVSSTNRGSQIGGALLGGILAGGVGAVVGGLSGSKTDEEKVKEITLQIVVNDTKNPIHKILFYKSINPQSQTIYKEYMDKAKYCHELVSVLIKQADEDDKLKEQKTYEPIERKVDKHSSPSLSEELSRLLTLKNDGVLSEEEFNTAKKKLLA